MFHSRTRAPAVPREGAAAPAPTPGGATPRPGDLSRLVREALEGHRVQMEFQPIAMAGVTGADGPFEGFARILDPGGQVIPATRFMGAVEESTIGRDLDCAALRLGLTALRAHPWLRLAVNASARSLGNATWRATLDAAAEEVGGRLTLELGEGSVTPLADRVARFMAELRPKGLRVVLDDFGIGPLSLRQLRDFRFDGVKIDRSFVKDIDRSPENQALVGALVSVAHRFGMTAVAKGVETRGEAACLRGLGTDGQQGYLFGRPGPLPE